MERSIRRVLLEEVTSESIFPKSYRNFEDASVMNRILGLPLAQHSSKVVVLER